MQAPFKPGEKIFRFTEYDYYEDGRDPDDDEVLMELGGVYTVAECKPSKYSDRWFVYLEEFSGRFYAKDFERCVKRSHLPKWMCE